MNLRSVYWLSALAIFPIHASSAGAQVPSVARPGSAPDSEPAVLRLDGQPILAREYETWLLDTAGESSAESYARQDALERELQRLGVAVDEEGLRSRIESEIAARIQGAFGGKKEDWLAELASIGLAEEGYRVERRAELRLEAAAQAIARVGRTIAPERIEQEWEGRFGPRGRSLEVLLLQTAIVYPTPRPGSSPADVDAQRASAEEQALDKARALSERARLGEDFGKLAAQLSDDAATRSRGGALVGPFKPLGWPDDFVQALSAMKPGEISQPLRARGGFWLANLVASKDTPLASVGSEIERELLAAPPDPQEVAAVQQRLWQGLEVEARPELWRARGAGEPADPVIFIGTRSVRRAEYGAWLRRNLGQRAAGRHAEEWAVRRAARAQNATTTAQAAQADAQADAERILSIDYRGDRQRYLRDVLRLYASEEAFLRELTRKSEIDLLATPLLQAARDPTDAELRAAWVDRYGPEGIGAQARRLALYAPVPPPEEPPPGPEQARARFEEAVKALREKAAELVRRARAGEDFATLAREHSQDEETRAQGGLVPGRLRVETLAEDVRAAVQSLQPGELSDPVQVGRAIYVYQLVEHRQVSFESVEIELAAALKTVQPGEAELATWRSKLGRAVKVEVLTEMFR